MGLLLIACRAVLAAPGKGRRRRQVSSFRRLAPVSASFCVAKSALSDQRMRLAASNRLSARVPPDVRASSQLAAVGNVRTFG